MCWVLRRSHYDLFFFLYSFSSRRAGCSVLSYSFQRRPLEEWRRRGEDSWAALSALAFVAAFCDGSSLLIDPRGEELERPIGESFLLTCRPNVADPSLIIDLKWLGPDNQTVREETDRWVIPSRLGEPIGKKCRLNWMPHRYRESH